MGSVSDGEGDPFLVKVIRSKVACETDRCFSRGLEVEFADFAKVQFFDHVFGLGWWFMWIHFETYLLEGFVIYLCS